MSPGDGAVARPAGRAGSAPRRELRARELRARGQQTLRRLLDAGSAVFADKGFHAARVDDIVKAARASHGTFYLYFTSKEDLFRALAEDVAASMASLARDLPALTPDASGFAALSGWLRRFLDLYEREASLLQVWTEAEIVDSELGQVGGDLVAQFARELATRLRTAAPDLEPRVAALAIVAMIERATYYLHARQIRVDRDELVETLAAVTHAGLFGADARRAPRPAATPVLRS